MKRKVVNIEEQWLTIASYVEPWVYDCYGEGYHPIVYYRGPYVSQEECNKLLKKCQEKYKNITPDAWKPPELEVYWKTISTEIKYD
jgi:hypothetical protein